MLVHLFYRGLVQAYLLFSNLIKLSFRPRHLLIHEPFSARKIRFEYHTEKSCNVFTLLTYFEESGTGISHKVGLATRGIGGYLHLRYYHLVALSKGNAQALMASCSSLLNVLIFSANQLSASCILRFCSSSTVCDIADARSCSNFSTVSSSTSTFFFMTLYFTIFAITKQ